jgi:Ca2+-transporting ATPase
MQLLWINLVSDIFPALSLAVEPPEPDILCRPPRDPREPIIGPADFKRYGFESLTITAGAMASYGYAITRYGIGPRAGSAAFMTLTLAQLLHAYSCRSDRSSIFNRETLRPNSHLNLAVGGTAALQLAAVAVPGLRSLLGIAMPSPMDMAVIAAGSALPFLVNEATKATKGGAHSTAPGQARLPFSGDKQGPR